MNREYRNRKIRTAAGEMREPGAGADRGGASLRGNGAGRRDRGRREGADRADSRRSGRQDRGDRQGSAASISGNPDRRRSAQPCRGGQGRGAGPCRAQAELLMKGSLHTDELLGAVVARETGLRTGRRISHVFIMDVPTYHKVLIVTDAAINIAPTLEDKVDICQNAIDLAISLGVDAAEGRHSRRGRDGHFEDAGHARRRGALQDGRARADHGRRFSMGRWRSTTPSARKRRRPRASSRRSPAIPTSCWRRISRRATSWPSSSASWPTPTARASFSAPGFRSS